MPSTTHQRPDPTRGRTRARIACPFIAVALACLGCGGDDLKKELDTATSWRATMQLASAEHRSGAITTRYSAQLAEEAREGKAELERTLPTVEHDASDRQRAAASLDSLDRAITALEAETAR